MVILKIKRNVIMKPLNPMDVAELSPEKMLIAKIISYLYSF